MTLPSLRELTSRFPGTAATDSARWADYTSMGAGTSRFFLAEAATMDELSRLLGFFRERKIGIFPLGDGTNLIGSDRPLEKVVISH